MEIESRQTERCIHQITREDLELVAQLKICTQEKDLRKGGRLHLDISRNGILKRNIFVGSALVNMYAKCGALVKAQKLLEELPFRNLVSWNGLIAGYAQDGQGEEALYCFDQMQEDGLSPNARTFTCILKACSSIGAFEKGREIYALVVRDGLIGFDAILGNAVIDMLAKFGALAMAQQVFDDLRSPTIVSWNTLIGGYYHFGRHQEALKCLDRMKCKGFCPDEVTFSYIVRACNNAETGKRIHDEISKNGLLKNGYVLRTALVHMYTKCGALEKAQEVFDEHPSHDCVAWTVLITGYCHHDLGEDAVHCYGQMKREGLSPDTVTLASVLKACGSICEIDKGREIHAHIIKEGFLGNIVVLWSAVVDMYMKCDAPAKAQGIFNEITTPDVISWTALISGYCQHGHGTEALKCFEQMKCEGLTPDAVTYTCILRTCCSMGAVQEGQMYFNSMSTSYGIIPSPKDHMCMVNLFGQSGKFNKVMEILKNIIFPADTSMWLALMQSCQTWGNLKVGRYAFEHAICLNKNCILAHVYMCNICTTVGMHDEARRLLGWARQMLEEITAQDVISWNTLITGYSQNGYAEEALDCFELMEKSGIPPDSVTFTCILKGCSTIRALEYGKKIHARIIKMGLLGHATTLGNALVDMYAKCGAFVRAEKTLHELPFWNGITWNALIAGYLHHGHGEAALKCFERLEHEGFHPDSVALACGLSACGSLAAAEKGERIHFEIVRKGLLNKDAVLGNCLVDMYAKCGSHQKAQEVFDKLPVRNMVSWNSLITGYCLYGYYRRAFVTFQCMKREGLSPNAVTFSVLLNVCNKINIFGVGKEFLVDIAGQGLLKDAVAVGNLMLDMYADCGKLAKALQILHSLTDRDVVSWNRLISGYSQHGYDKEAVTCFRVMRREGIAPNVSTFALVLKACGNMSALQMGREIHDDIVKEGLSKNGVLESALVDMYMKCGELLKAQELFDSLSSRSAVSWTTLMTGYFRLGYGEKALNCLEQMENEKVFPDSVTLSCVLKACASMGALEKGQWYMETMKARYGILPSTQHYTCLVDLFSRAGHFSEAINVIEKLPARHDLPAWFSFLCACQSGGNVDLGAVSFEHGVFTPFYGKERGGVPAAKVSCQSL